MVLSETFTLGRITLLALADSVNPCAIAVLAMILMAILIQNPEKRKKVLLAGIGFVLAVYIGYLVYGLIIIQFFRLFAGFLRESSSYIYNGLAILAMIIGALNIKDFFFYKKGSFATEMPLFMRPKVKKIIDGVTSPVGAFVIGFLVTLFLLPCTIGPYVVASGLLSELGIIGALPWLLYYNLIFVIPMIIITLIVYWGFRRVEDVSGWKEKNIKKLHLIAGILLFLVGLGILLGWI
ncbi:MAG: cytochrome c biogenesis CcdA family protein [Nanobdellota archaeon]